MLSTFRGAIAAIAILLNSCSTPIVLTAEGPNRDIASGQFAIFAKAYDSAWETPSTTYAKNLLEQGLSLVYNNCMDFFRREGKLQTTLNVIRDTTALVGSVAAGAIAALHTSQDAAAVVSLTVAGVSGGITVANANFLFGTDNIDAVRELIVRALATHHDQIEQAANTTPTLVTVPWALDQIQDHQALCRPAHILSLTRSAIKNGDIEPYNAGATATTAIGSTRQQMDDFDQTLAQALGVGAITDEQAAALYWFVMGRALPNAYPMIATKLRGLGDKSPFGAGNQPVPGWAARERAQQALQASDIKVKARLEQIIGSWMMTAGPTPALGAMRAPAGRAVEPALGPEAKPSLSLPSHFGVRVKQR